MIQSIAHPTDFSEASAEALAHALRLALDTRSRLYLLHVSHGGQADWTSFPHMREILAAWGLLDAGAPRRAIEEKLGVEVVKVDIQHRDAATGLFDFLLGHRPDLIVLATHGREGVDRWFKGSVAEELAREVHVPTLFLGPNAVGFVDRATGAMQLARILVPVAETPSPRLTLNTLGDLLTSIRASAASVDLMHVGSEAPPGFGDEVELRQGAVVETILDVARERDIQLIAMPTAGHHGFLDALRGSTTERVLRQASCPVLAVGAFE